MSRTERIASRTRNAKWQRPPLRIEMLECINCDKCIPACPPQFGAIVHHRTDRQTVDVVIVPELCSGCDKCLPVCPVDCIYPFPEWESSTVPAAWWDAVRMTTLIPGAEPMSHHGSLPYGALVVHGFTGNCGSMRIIADAFAAAGWHVEMPLLPGHGTTVDDMLPTRWPDWVAATNAAYQSLAGRVEDVVVVGLSMGGALTLQMGADHPGTAGLVCINPATQPQPPEVVDMIRGMLDAGTEVMPGIGSDIADPNVKETAYEGTPLRPLLSMLDGVGELAPRYPSISAPLLLLNSPQDHVVDPAQAEFLASTYGGPVERVSLDRSYHVATQDYDKDLIVERTLAFAASVVA